MDKPIAYHLAPVSENFGGISTACIMSCMVTGNMLSGYGGGGDFISPEVFDLLSRDQEVQSFIRDKLAGK